MMEPFKIKMVEPIYFSTKEERIQYLKNADYNLFRVKAEHVIIDLLTDSGTCAMSDRQWAAMIRGDESYAGSSSFYHFEEVVKSITGYKHVIPAHQGRAAEHILFSQIVHSGDIVLNNSHFDTTLGNIIMLGGNPVNCNDSFDTLDTLDYHDFKGNMDIDAFEKTLKEQNKKIPLVMMTITNNTAGGQPVSMENIRAVSRLCKEFDKPFFLDAARFVENCYFIKIREKGYSNKSIKEIARELFSLADGMTMSAKKDAVVNMGGIIAMNDDTLAEKCKHRLIYTEGFPTYGGLSGRDLEAIAQGLTETLDEHYISHRIESVKYFGDMLSNHNIPIVHPVGGHAIFIDALKFCDHLPQTDLPGLSLSCSIYLEGGIRGCELGTVAFSRFDPEQKKYILPKRDLVRLAIPRRVYTKSHLEYCAEHIIALYKKRHSLKGMDFTYRSEVMSHFTSKYCPKH